MDEFKLTKYLVKYNTVKLLITSAPQPNPRLTETIIKILINCKTNKATGFTTIAQAVIQQTVMKQTTTQILCCDKITFRKQLTIILRNIFCLYS